MFSDVDRFHVLWSNEGVGNFAHYYRSLGDVVMAVQTGNVSLELSVLDRGWLKQCIDTQRKVLLRSRTKEITGGEIWSLRGKEIEALTALLAKVSV